MSAQFPQHVLSKKLLIAAVIAFCVTISQAATVSIHPGQNIPAIVAQNPAGTIFLIYPGTYRLTAHIVPKSGDQFIGQTACAPPKTACPAILTGSRVIGSLATFNGVNYQVTGQTQNGLVSQPSIDCQTGYTACNLPEDLFFDGVPLRRLPGSSLPVIGAKEWWFDHGNSTIYFHDSPSGHTVETSVLDTAFLSSANNVTIKYLTVRDFANPLQRGAIEATDGNPSPTSSLNWVISNVEAFNNHAAGVRVAFGTKVYNSYLHDNGSLGVDGGTNSPAASGIVVQNNTITHNNYAKVLSASGAGGFKVGYTVGLVLRGNNISNNDGTGVHFDENSAAALVDGNVIENNAGGAGVGWEISVSSATIRNNIVLKNALPDLAPIFTAGMNSVDSIGVNFYCNTVEVPNAPGSNAIMIIASNRGKNYYAPYEYMMSKGNSYHHNSIFWDAGAIGVIGFWQQDPINQPNFFADNAVPDYNEYHLPSLGTANFVYDNNNSKLNSRKTFTEYQAAGADRHGSADAKYNAGFPALVINSPVDQATFTGTSVPITATASDSTGINRVEFYVDWALAKTVTGTPYTYDWANMAVGTHIVTAMAYSNSGIRSCYAVTLTKQ